MHIKTTDQEKLDQTIREIAELEARLEKLARLKAALIDLVSTPLPVVPRRTKRAPHGVLQAAVLEIMDDGQEYTNGDIREGLELRGYPYLIDNLNIRKTMDSLDAAHKVVASRRHGRVFFTKSEKGIDPA